MKIDLFTQNDNRWYYESMGHPEDFLGEYGCLVTCYANISLAALPRVFTPAVLNLLIKLDRGYLGLAVPDCPVERRSFLLHDPVARLLRCEINHQVRETHFGKKHIYYIARLDNEGRTHFVNVINETGDGSITVFDVYSGERKTISRKTVTSFTEVIF